MTATFTRSNKTLSVGVLEMRPIAQARIEWCDFDHVGRGDLRPNQQVGRFNAVANCYMDGMPVGPMCPPCANLWLELWADLTGQEVVLHR